MRCRIFHFVGGETYVSWNLSETSNSQRSLSSGCTKLENASCVMFLLHRLQSLSHLETENWSFSYLAWRSIYPRYRIYWAATKGNRDIVKNGFVVRKNQMFHIWEMSCSMGLLHWTGRDSEETLLLLGQTKKDNMFYFTICPPLLLAAENGQLESIWAWAWHQDGGPDRPQQFFKHIECSPLEWDWRPSHLDAVG